MVTKQTAASLLVLFLLAGSVGYADDWPRWRGPENSASVATGNYPSVLDPSKVVWKVALPGKGCSTPIILNRTLFLTVPSEGEDAVLAYDMKGRKLWETRLGEEKEGRHRNGSGSNPSPITDGKSLYVNYKSGTLAALDLMGKVKWKLNLVDQYGPVSLYWDYGTSPVLTRDHVVIARMHEGDSWLAAFDKETGGLVWKVDRNYKTPREGDHGYASPQIIRHQGSDAILVWGTGHLTAHKPEDGSMLWSCGGFNPEEKALWPAVATPIVVGDMAVVPYGRNDRKLPRLHGIKLGGSGDVTSTHRLWMRDDISSFVPSPASYKGGVYLLRDRGEIECVDPVTGKNHWSAALPKDRSNYYASPLIAGGKLYAAREDGVVFVADVEGEFRLLSENDLGEPIIAMPVPFDGQILIKGTKNLFLFGSGS